jgi:HEPN domain-containing protein
MLAPTTMNRGDLRQLAETRLAEAQMLLGAGMWSGAYYLVGYAVECGLKACIAKSTKQDDFPVKARVIASHTHDLAQLVGVAGIRAELEAESGNDAAFSGYWGVVSQWNEESRYRQWTEADAMELVEAVSDVDHGVLRWLKTRW